MLDLHQNPQLVRKGVLHIPRVYCTTFERGIKHFSPLCHFRLNSWTMREILDKMKRIIQ